jgi:hypothetical protein
MAAAERDDTHDWLLPEGSAPPLLSELEQRIDQALIIAKASERAVVEVGDAALEAAAQARRAADAAERASETALGASAMPGPEVPAASGQRPLAAPAFEPKSPVPGGDEALRSFSERADRVVARLRALERRPRGSHPASAVAAPRRSGG